MTKKHYTVIAEKIKAHKLKAKTIDGKLTTRLIAYDIADVLLADNPRFDRSKFLGACGHFDTEY